MAENEYEATRLTSTHCMVFGLRGLSPNGDSKNPCKQGNSVGGCSTGFIVWNGQYAEHRFSQHEHHPFSNTMDCKLEIDRDHYLFVGNVPSGDHQKSKNGSKYKIREETSNEYCGWPRVASFVVLFSFLPRSIRGSDEIVMSRYGKRCYVEDP